MSGSIKDIVMNIEIYNIEKKNGGIHYIEKYEAVATLFGDNIRIYFEIENTAISKIYKVEILDKNINVPIIDAKRLLLKQITYLDQHKLLNHL